MKRLTYSVVVAAILGLGAYAAAGAQAPAAGPGAGPRADGLRGPGAGRVAMPMMMLRGIELTDQQREQVRAIVQQERESGGTVAAEGPLHRQLQAEVFAEGPDLQKLAVLQQQLAQAQADRIARQVAIGQHVAQVLTPEQRAAVRARLASAPERRGPAVRGGAGERDGPRGRRAR